MTRIRSILCPVDFSEPSREAWAVARALAVRFHARVTVLHAVEPLLAQAAAATFHDQLLPATEADLRAFVAVPPAGAFGWTPHPILAVAIGDPWSEIVGAADRYDADLIVMGTHGLGGVRKLVFGSTTERVLRDARVPVLAVPPGGGEAARLEDPGARVDWRGVLAGVDLEPGSVLVTRVAADLARSFDVPLVLAHVVRPVEASTRWRVAQEAADALHRAAVESELDRLAAMLPRGAETAVLDGRAPEALTSLAAARHLGLIVMGTGSGGGLLSRRPGSTAYRLLSLTTVPVLAIPPARVSEDARVARAREQVIW